MNAELRASIAPPPPPYRGRSAPLRLMAGSLSDKAASVSRIARPQIGASPRSLVCDTLVVGSR